MADPFRLSVYRGANGGGVAGASPAFRNPRAAGCDLNHIAEQSPQLKSDDMHPVLRLNAETVTELIESAQRNQNK
jgi:hypothetical protein